MEAQLVSSTGRTESSYDFVGTSGQSLTVEGDIRQVLVIPLFDTLEGKTGGLVMRVFSRRPKRLLRSFMHPLHQEWTPEKMRAAAEIALQWAQSSALTDGVDLDLELIKDYR